MSFVVSAPAMAQDAAAMTSGGDVTAEEATPLPPVVVEAPSQPLARKKKQQKSIGSAGSTPAATAPQQGRATTGDATGDTGTAGVGIYTLGQLDLIGGSTITNEAMWTFNKNIARPGAEHRARRVPSQQQRRQPQRARHPRARLRPLPRAALHGRRAHLPAGRQPPRLQPLPDAGPRRDPGAEGLRLGAQRPGRHGRRHQPRQPQADQGGRARRARRRRVRRRPRLHGPVEQLRLRRHAPEGLLRAGQRHDRRPGPLRPVRATSRQSRASALPAHSASVTPTRTAATATTRTSTTGASTPRSASRRTPPTSTASTTPSRRATRARRCTSTGRSCRVSSSSNNERLLGLADWDISTLSWLSKTQARRCLLHKDERVLQHLRQQSLLPSTTGATRRSLIDSVYDDYSSRRLRRVGHRTHSDEHPQGRRSTTAATSTRNGTSTTTPRPTGSFTGEIADRDQPAEETWSFAVENTFHATRYFDFVTGVSYDEQCGLAGRLQDSSAPTVSCRNLRRPASTPGTGKAAAIYGLQPDRQRRTPSVSSRTRFPTLVRPLQHPLRHPRGRSRSRSPSVPPTTRSA